MARREGRIDSMIWEDKDFLALPRAAQGTYFFLISQRDLSHAGVIPLRELRWTAKSSDGSDALAVDLPVLEAARFVVIDRGTEELLVRSLMRRDKVYRQPNVMLAAVDSVSTVTSALLVAELLVEIGRIEKEELTDAQALSVSKMRSALTVRLKELSGPASKEAHETATFDVSAQFTNSHLHISRTATPSGKPEVAKGSPNPSANPSRNPTADPPGERGVVRTVSTDSPFPVPRSPDPVPQTLVDLTADTSAKQAKAAAPNDFDRFWGIYPRREAKGAARKAWNKAIAAAPVEQILNGATAYRDDGARRRADPKYTKLPATWLNAECWTDERSALNQHKTNGHQAYRNPTDLSIYESDL